jgi:pimeloyl-ACP methyl ester carboxylesterase
LDFDGMPQVRTVIGRAAHGGLRQALVPERWDGARAIVLLGGAGAYAAAYPAPIAHLLAGAPDRPPVAVAFEDIPGYGFSAERRRWADICTIDEIVSPQIDFIEALPTLLGGQPAVTPVGFSLGGQVVLHVLLRRPDLLASVVAIAPLVRVAGTFGAWWFRQVLRAAAPLPYVGSRYLYRRQLRDPGRRAEADAHYSDDYRRRMDEDPYLDDSVLLRSLHAITRGGAALLSRPPPLRPVRVLHAATDLTCSFDASAVMVRRWRSAGANVDLLSPGEFPHQLLHLRPPHCYRVHSTLDLALRQVWGESPRAA